RLALRERPRVDPGERKVSVRVADDLERQRAEGRVGVWRPLLDPLEVLRVLPLDVADVERAREVVHDRVEDRLDADVLERRAAQRGKDVGRETCVAQAGLQVRWRELVA